MPPDVGAARIAAAFRVACRLDVEARKPGNVSVVSPGHRMVAAQFLASAEAAAAPLSAPGAAVGRRIEGAMRATWTAVGCNTNLGIVLLCAPLAGAAEAAGSGPRALRAALAGVLDALDLDDARGAYAAIALARPAGLGAVPDQDVARPPTVDLRAAMALAAHADRIARQYVTGFAEVFDVGLAAWDAARAAGGDARRAMQQAFVAFVASAPDSHIERKHGAAVAQSVMSEARRWRDVPAAAPLDDDPAWAAWDAALKGRGLNPGTSADLSVATAMAAALRDPAGMECVGHVVGPGESDRAGDRAPVAEPKRKQH